MCVCVCEASLKKLDLFCVKRDTVLHGRGGLPRDRGPAWKGRLPEGGEMRGRGGLQAAATAAAAAQAQWAPALEL